MVKLDLQWNSNILKEIEEDALGKISKKHSGGVEIVSSADAEDGFVLRNPKPKKGRSKKGRGKR